MKIIANLYFKSKSSQINGGGRGAKGVPLKIGTHVLFIAKVVKSLFFPELTAHSRENIAFTGVD